VQDVAGAGLSHSVDAMRAVVAREPGGPEVLEIRDVPDPEPSAGEVVIDVVASAVNRADILQRMGNYEPPPGASDILGLEVSGTVSSVGPDVQRWRDGDRVCALLSSGGYAEKVAAPAGQVLPVPAGVDLRDAAALPEVVCTVWSNVFTLAGLQPGELLLAHGGAGGIGTMAIQLAKALGTRVVVTVGSEEKARFVRELGADLAINYRAQDFLEELLAYEPRGADVILDNMGASYLPRNVAALATAGRLLVIGLQGGVNGELNLGALMSKRAAVISTTLRSRPLAEKAAIVASVEENVWPLIADGSVRPIVDRSFALDQVAQAHALVEAGGHVGKVLVTT
jgi:putative PIG3 family NAD(P)H quinone oxidoreductase